MRRTVACSRESARRGCPGAGPAWGPLSPAGATPRSLRARRDAGQVAAGHAEVRGRGAQPGVREPRVDLAGDRRLAGSVGADEHDRQPFVRSPRIPGAWSRRAARCGGWRQVAARLLGRRDVATSARRASRASVGRGRRRRRARPRWRRRALVRAGRRRLEQEGGAGTALGADPLGAGLVEARAVHDATAQQRPDEAVGRARDAGEAAGRRVGWPRRWCAPASVGTSRTGPTIRSPRVRSTTARPWRVSIA